MQKTVTRTRGVLGVLAAALAASGLLAAQAGAHAHVSPSIVQKGSENFTLVVPSEGGTTTSVQVDVPDGLQIGAFEPLPGVKRTAVATGTGDEAVVSQVTWTGLKVPDGEAAYLRFQGSIEKAGDFALKVRQTYADGKVSDWSGPESSDSPAPRLEAVDELAAGGSSSTTGTIALIVAILALLLGLAAVARRGGRPLT